MLNALPGVLQGGRPTERHWAAPRPLPASPVPAQVANDEPQPQVRVAFGLRNLNPAPCSPVT